MHKITLKNYFETVEKLGFENLPLVLKQSHTVIMTKTDNGRDWSRYKSDAELKRMIDLVFKKLQEFSASRKTQPEPQDLSGVKKIKSKKINFKYEHKFISRVLELNNHRINKDELNQLIEDLQTAITLRKITRKSPFAEEIMFIQKGLVNIYNAMKVHVTTIQLQESSIKKLQLALEKTSEWEKSIWSEGLPEKQNDVSLKGIEIIQQQDTSSPKVMSSIEFSELYFNTIGFKDKWLAFIGDPAPGFTAMVFGMPKMGKSYLCVDFAGYLARNHGKVLYVAKEEKLDKTLQDKLKDKEVAHPNLFVADALPKDLSAYDFIFLDSVNKLGLSPKDLEKLKAENRGKSFVYVFQATKDGKFKGNNEFQHDVDVVIEVPEQGKAVQFGRFNQGGEMNIFPDSAIDLTFKENVSMLAGVNDNKMNKKSKSAALPRWTQLEHLSEKDSEDLKEIYRLHQDGKMKEALKYASDLDTIVREEIPVDVWKAIGGELTPTGKEKLKKKLSKKSQKDLSRYDDRDDANNPRYLFSLTSTRLLCEALKKEFDIFYLVRKELANRGQDGDGNWVGFKKAKEIHKV